MFSIGRICIKTAGRDAGKRCVVVDVVDKNHVLIDGQTRRKKCNVKHLEPLGDVLKISKNAPKTEIVRVFKTLNIDIKETKPKKISAKPKKTRTKKVKPVKELKEAKKAAEKKQEAKQKPKPETINKKKGSEETKK